MKNFAAYPLVLWMGGWTHLNSLSFLINTGALARCGAARSVGSRFNGFSAYDNKPLKRLNSHPPGKPPG